MVRDKELEQYAATLYSDTLPYHNFTHALQCIEAGHELVRRCREEGVAIDEHVVYYALLFHDAGYHEDHFGKGYPTKEAYSAALAEAALNQRGVAPATVQQVTAAILATRRDARFVSVEEKAVRAADLSGLAADYGVFRANTEKLKYEYEIMTGGPISWDEWIAMADEVVSYFLSQDIRLTRYYFDESGDSIFHKRTMANLNRLRAERGA
ncbi:MAG TPA: hypothetical protein VMH34_02065 [Gammaproteobacteria bacterium]|nr:hypothetical protein [Gammaproteobacteria bacterium]